MSPLHLLFALGLLLSPLAWAADSTVSFNNNNLGTPRLVTFDWSWGDLSGTGVRNGVADGRNFTAQLVFADSGVEIGAPANFRASTTASPGTWSGGTRTMVGVPRGTPVMLQVLVKDAATGFTLGSSAPFRFVDQMSNPPGAADNFMLEFQGFSINRTGGGGSVVVPPSVSCPPNSGPVTIKVVEGDVAAMPLAADPVTAELVRNAPASLELGAWSGVYPAMTFKARMGIYGRQSFQTGYHLAATTYCAQDIILDVAPNPERYGPRLRLTPGSPNLVSLLGLTNRTYRVEISKDLKAWTLWWKFKGTMAPLLLDLNDAGLGFGVDAAFYVRALNPTNAP